MDKELEKRREVHMSTLLGWHLCCGLHAHAQQSGAVCDALGAGQAGWVEKGLLCSAFHGQTYESQPYVLVV